jgi:hypothetical protein
MNKPVQKKSGQLSTAQKADNKFAMNVLQNYEKFNSAFIFVRRWENAVGIVTKPALRLTHPPIKCSPWALSPGSNQPGCEIDQSALASAQVKKIWIHTSTDPYTFIA